MKISQLALFPLAASQYMDDWTKISLNLETAVGTGLVFQNFDTDIFIKKIF